MRDVKWYDLFIFCLFLSTGFTLIKSLPKRLGDLSLLIHHILDFVQTLNKLRNGRYEALEHNNDYNWNSSYSESDLVSLVEVEYRPLAPLIGKLSDIRAGPADVITSVLVLVLELAISLSPSEDQEGEEEDGGP